MPERSGTDQQIADRIKRGDTVRAIRDELGCGGQRIKDVAKRYGLTMRAARRFVPGQRVLNRRGVVRAGCKMAQVHLALPEGWLDLVITYPLAGDSNGVIEIKRAK